MNEREVSLTVNPADILPLIKQSLYAEREVFLRELISNALDALTRVDKAYRFDAAFVEDVEPLRVEIQLDPTNRRLIISDNGDGMGEAEVIQNINQIAFSGARKFVEEDLHRKERMIGRFGVGFYSSFMVSNRVEIDSWSWKPDCGGCHWISDGTEKTKLSAPQRSSRGTTITCHLASDADEFLNPDRLEMIIRRYLDFAPYPIFLAGRQVNLVTAPWHLSKAEREKLPRDRYIELFKRLNPGENKPLTWLEVEVDFPVELHAVLFVPNREDGQPGKIRLYSDRIFVCDHVDELLPKWLSFLDGVLDSADLPINVSRERFHLDQRIRRVAQFLTAKAVDTLACIVRDRQKDYMAIWERYGILLKKGYVDSSMQKNLTLASKLEEILMFTSSRQPCIKLSEYRERLPDSAKQHFLYLSDERTQSVHLELWRNRNREVLFLTHPLDMIIIEMLKQAHPEWDFLRVDQVKINEPDTSASAVPLPAVDATSTDSLTDLMRRVCGDMVTKITVATLPSRDIPAILQMRQEGIEKEFIRKWTGDKKEGLADRELVLNANSPLIQRLTELARNDNSNEFVGGLATQLWDNVRINAGLLSENDLLQLARRNAEFLTLVARGLPNLCSKIPG